MHDVPLSAFSADGLSVIASKVGEPMMLDAYTSEMCSESWGRSSYARAMVEVSAKQELKKHVVVAVPKVDKEGYVLAKIKIEYEWTPPHCSACKIFGHTNEECPKVPKQEAKKVSTGVDADGYQQVKSRNKHFKQKQNFIFRPKVTMQSKGGDTEATYDNGKQKASSSNEGNKHGSDGRNKQVAHEIKTTNAFGALAGLSNDELVSNKDTGGAQSSASQDTGNGKQVGQQDKTKAAHFDDESDVETIYDETNILDDSTFTGASTPATLGIHG